MVVMTWDEFDEIPVAVYQQGMWFGDFEVYKNVGRLFSCVSMTDVELFTLSKKDFKRIFFQEYVDFGNYFLHKMDVNFENLENTMEIVYHILFPKSVTRTVDIKLDIIKNQRKMISQISEMKNTQFRRKSIITSLRNKEAQNKEHFKNLKNKFNIISQTENTEIDMKEVNKEMFTSNQTSDMVRLNNSNEVKCKENGKETGIKIGFEKYRKRKNQTSIGEGNEQKLMLFQGPCNDKDTITKEDETPISIPRTPSLFNNSARKNQPKSPKSVTSKEKLDLLHVSIEAMIPVQKKVGLASFHKLDSTSFKEKFKSKENFIETYRKSSQEIKNIIRKQSTQNTQPKNYSKRSKSKTKRNAVIQKRKVVRDMLNDIIQKMC
jgi:hypothetical protein